MSTRNRFPVNFLLTNLKSINLDKVNTKEDVNYTFFTKKESDINFSKILDDLSYEDPLRIVKFKDQTFAVIHHSIYDKYIRSKSADLDIHDYINVAVSKINNSEISTIIQNIRDIKRLEWLFIEHPNYKRNSKQGYTVEVIKPNI